jgi:hypothetical protein
MSGPCPPRAPAAWHQPQVPAGNFSVHQALSRRRRAFGVTAGTSGFFIDDMDHPFRQPELDPEERDNE